MTQKNIIQFIVSNDFLAERDYYKYYGYILRQLNNNIKLYNKIDLFYTCTADVTDIHDIEMYCVIYFNLMDNTDKGFNILHYFMDKDSKSLMKVSCNCTNIIRIMMDKIKDKFYNREEFIYLVENLSKFDYNSDYTNYHVLNLIAKSISYSNFNNIIDRVNHYSPKYVDAREYNKLEETFSKISRDVYVTSYTQQVIIDPPVEIKSLLEIGTDNLADYIRRSSNIFIKNYNVVKDFITETQCMLDIGIDEDKVYGLNTCILVLSLKYSNHFNLLDNVEIVSAFNYYIENYDYYEFEQDLSKAVEFLNCIENDEIVSELYETTEFGDIVTNLILIGDLLNVCVEFIKYELSRKLVNYNNESSMDNYNTIEELLDKSPSGQTDIEIVERFYKQKYVEVKG